MTHKSQAGNNSSNLYKMGYHPELKIIYQQTKKEGFELARVVKQFKDCYTIDNGSGQYDAEILGNLRFTAQSNLDFPAVGDWVKFSAFEDTKALIHAIAFRNNLLKRKAVGRQSEEQIIATNIDCSFIVESVSRDFNISRFERYAAICTNEGIEPIFVLNKADLIDPQELDSLVSTIKNRLPNTQLIITSCTQEKGLNDLLKLIESGKTYCFLGSSGVGKSSLINLIAGQQHMKTNVISVGAERGKHTTTHRELIVLKHGGILIDNPGMREIGMSSTSKGITMVFEQITELAEHCGYADCTHEHEFNCAVLDALNSNELDQEAYDNFLKLKRETAHFSSNEAEKRQKGKNLAKLIKQAKNKKRW